MVEIRLAVFPLISSFTFCSGLRKRIFSAIECPSAVGGHPRPTIILVPIESAYVTFY